MIRTTNMTFGLSGNISSEPTVLGGADISHLLQKARAAPLPPAEKKKVVRLAAKIEKAQEEEKMPARDLRAQYGN